MKRMQGFNVFHPMGFDAFGLLAENYAIKTGIHPKDSTLKNIKTMEGQFQAMGSTVDWDYEFATCYPDTTNGTSGSLYSSTTEVSRTERTRLSTGVLHARLFSRTSR